eukprot:2692641-Prymnesium_polylepis.2
MTRACARSHGHAEYSVHMTARRRRPTSRRSPRRCQSSGDTHCICFIALYLALYIPYGGLSEGVTVSLLYLLYPAVSLLYLDCICAVSAVSLLYRLYRCCIAAISLLYLC